MAVEVPAEFINFLRVEQERGVDTSLADKRATALEFYQGMPFGDEVEGRSQAVTRDVSEVVDWLVVDILDTMLASGKVVQFETEPEPAPEQPQDGQQAPQQPPAPVMADYGEEATAAIQYYFMRKQRGYFILHDSLKAGLLEMSGIVKSFAEPRPDVHREHLVLADEIAMTGDGPQYDGRPVLQADAADEGWQPGLHSNTWKVRVAHPQPPTVSDAAVPNEYFRVSPDATDLDTAVYVGEVMPKSMSDMVELGYDPKELEGIWSAAPADTVVEQARDSERSQSRDSIGQRDGANKGLWLEEAYPLYDLDGDGITERLFVHRIGNVVLKVMPIAEQPYSIWSPFPMQHRLIGQSVADKTMDIQRIRSVLLRQGLDSQYLANSPRTLVNEASMTVDTLDDLLTVRPGGIIRHKGDAPTPFEQRDTSDIAFKGMEMMSAERESRTGVTRQSQGMNPDTMNKTASGMAMLQGNSQQIGLYITRNYAEFVAMMFAKRYRLMRQHTAPFRMKIQGKYQTVDPSKWPEDIDMTINVGLGTGNKDQKLQYRMSLLGVQQQVMMAGLPIVGPEEIYQNVKGLVEDSGLGVASDYIKDPAGLPPQEPKPDPEMAKAQAEATIKANAQDQSHQQAMTKLQLQQESQQAEAAIKSDAAQQDLDTKRAAAAQAAQLAEDKAIKEAQLADQQQAFEMDMAERRFAFDQEMARKKHDAMIAQATLTSNRPGGSLDA
jgi:hypothetical protein